MALDLTLMSLLRLVMVGDVLVGEGEGSLDALWDGTNHIMHLAWADNRDIPAGEYDLDPVRGLASNNVGNRNQNLYADKLVVSA